MKDRRVIELTFHWSQNFSIETMINLERNKTLDARSKSERTYSPAFIEYADYGNHQSEGENRGLIEKWKSDRAYCASMNEDPIELKKGSI